MLGGNPPSFISIRGLKSTISSHRVLERQSVKQAQNLRSQGFVTRHSSLVDATQAPRDLEARPPPS